MRISDWSSDVCSSDLAVEGHLTAVEIVYIVSSLLNVAYLLPIVARGFFLPASNPATGPVARSVGAAAAPVAGGIREAPFLCVLPRSEEHTSELQSLMRISYAVFCLKKKQQKKPPHT